MSPGGRGDNRGNRRRHFRRQQQEKNPSVPVDANDNKSAEHPRWIQPKPHIDAAPAPECPYCGKPIKDLSLAISDKNSDKAVHFDCIIARLSQGENLEPGDVISYLGGGRFGVVHFGPSQNSQGFTIKKIFEWENKENRAEWRQAISEQFSVT